mgnify:CR=1 FL=1
MTIEERITSLIESREMSKAAFCETAGLKRQNLNSMLKSPSYPTLIKIATALDVPMWQLFASPSDVAGGDEELTASISYRGEFFNTHSKEELKQYVDKL